MTCPGEYNIVCEDVGSDFCLMRALLNFKQAGAACGLGKEGDLPFFRWHRRQHHGGRLQQVPQGGVRRLRGLHGSGGEDHEPLLQVGDRGAAGAYARVRRRDAERGEVDLEGVPEIHQEGPSGKAGAPAGGR